MKTIKYITTKKFPVQVQYKTPVWDYKSKTFKNDLEKEFIPEGIVFITKKHIDNSFKLPSCSPIFHYKQNDWNECVEIFND